jgi:hypothetical protein
VSVEAMSIVLHHSRAEGRALVILLGIANHAGDGGAWPTLATLAKYGRCSERHAKRLIDQLARSGELGVVRQAGGTRDCPDWQRPNRYEVTLSCPESCDRTTAHRRRSTGLSTAVDEPLPVPELSRSDRVTPVSPGDVGVTRGGDIAVSPKPSIEPSMTAESVENVTTTRATRPTGLPPELVHKHASAARAALYGDVAVDLADDSLASQDVDLGDDDLAHDCPWCPPGCKQCVGDRDCECYAHQDEPDRHVSALSESASE